MVGLWLAAILLAPKNARDGASVVRLAAVIGTAIPLGLAIVHGLYALTTAIALACLIAFASWRTLRLRTFENRSFAISPGAWLPLVAVVAVTWPAIVRPELQGDSLGYHLPNAAMWVTTHSIWITGTNYWFYPGGSELFAAGLFAIAGPYAIGLAGFVPLLLLALRLYELARREGWEDLPAGAFAAACATAPVFAIQAGSLENDVWLAAFALEAYWCARYDRANVAVPLAMVGLLKPNGWLFATLIAIAYRVPRRLCALAAIPFVFWISRDLILEPHALLDPASLKVANVVGTTIAGNGIIGFTTLAHAILAQGVGLVLASLAVFIVLVTSRDRALQFCILAFGAFYLIEPFGFQDSNPQLATGASLRYAVPMFVLAFAGSLALDRRFQRTIAVFLAALAAYQGAHIVRIFYNDTTTHGLPIILTIVVLACIVDRARARGLAVGLVAMSLVSYAARLNGTHPIDYLDDALTNGSGTTHVFEWIAQNRPRAIVGNRIPIGAISIASPATIVYDADRVDPCREARLLHASLIIVTMGSSPASSCGPIAYKDATATIFTPNPDQPLARASRFVTR